MKGYPSITNTYIHLYIRSHFGSSEHLSFAVFNVVLRQVTSVTTGSATATAVKNIILKLSLFSQCVQIIPRRSPHALLVLQQQCGSRGGSCRNVDQDQCLPRFPESKRKISQEVMGQLWTQKPSLLNRQLPSRRPPRSNSLAWTPSSFPALPWVLLRPVASVASTLLASHLASHPLMYHLQCPSLTPHPSNPLSPRSSPPLWPNKWGSSRPPCPRESDFNWNTSLHSLV